MQRKVGPIDGHRVRRRSSRVARRGRVVMGGGGLAVAAAAIFLFLPQHASGIVIPSDACVSRPPLTTDQGVTLQPLAMAAFKKAEQDAGQTIPVVWSYRSCAQQRVACRNICGRTQCAGRCAAPGTSWHQMGAAIDTTQHGLDTPAVVAALKANGWCEPLPTSDPGHFSFGGCH